MNAITSPRVETRIARPAEHQHVLDALAACNRPEMTGRDDAPVVQSAAAHALHHHAGRTEYSASMTYSSFSTRTLVGVQPGRSRMSVTAQPCPEEWRPGRESPTQPYIWLLCGLALQ